MKIIQVNDQTIDQLIKQSLKQGAKQSHERQSWKPTYKLQRLSLPQAVHSPSKIKKFKIALEYRDDTNTLRSRLIYFGSGDEYAFNRNINSRLKKLQTAKFIKNRGDLLSPQYWETTLLMVSDDFVKNTMQVIKNQLQHTWNQANDQRTRRKQAMGTLKKPQAFMNQLKKNN